MFKPLRGNRRSPWYPRALSLLICLGVFGAIATARALGWIEFLELKAYDLLLAAREKDSSVSNRLVVVGMTEPDINRYDYPIPDEMLAALIERVLAGGARAVGVDIFRDKPVPKNGEGRAALVKVMADRRVVMPMRHGTTPEDRVAPPPEAKPAQVGAVDFPTDDDGRVRRALPFFTDYDGTPLQTM